MACAEAVERELLGLPDRLCSIRLVQARPSQRLRSDVAAAEREKRQEARNCRHERAINPPGSDEQGLRAFRQGPNEGPKRVGEGEERRHLSGDHLVRAEQASQERRGRIRPPQPSS